MVLLSLAVTYAVSLEAPAVYYGAHSGDHAIYPDCRPEFVQKMKDVCAIANYEPVSIETPFLHHSKGEILAVGKALELITAILGPVITDAIKHVVSVVPVLSASKHLAKII